MDVYVLWDDKASPFLKWLGWDSEGQMYQEGAR